MSKNTLLSSLKCFFSRFNLPHLQINNQIKPLLLFFSNRVNNWYSEKMLQGSLWRQASRVYGSAGSGRRNSGVLSDLCMKLGLVRVTENVSLPCGLSFKNSIHSGRYLCRENGENERPSLNTERRSPGSMERPQLFPEVVLNTERRSLGSMERPQLFPGGVLNIERRSLGSMERPQLFPEAGRTRRSMDYVQGLFNEERGNVLNGRTGLYQPLSEDGMARRPMDQFQGVRQERGPGFGEGPLYHQPSFESNADIVHIKLTRNNSFVTLTDSQGNKKLGISAAVASGKGDKPGRYSAEAAAEYVGRRVRQMRLRSVVVKVSGHTFFKRKKDAILAFKDGYTNSRGDVNPIVHIEDTTRKPHNGCRLPKQRRI